MVDEIVAQPPQTSAPVEETVATEGATPVEAIATEATPTPEPIDPLEALGDEGLRKHPKVQKLLQQESDRRVTDAVKTHDAKVRAQIAQEARTAQDQQALADMSDEEYGKYVRDNQRLSTYVDQERQKTFAEAYTAVVVPLVNALPEEARKTFMEGTPRYTGPDGVKNFTEDLTKALKEAGVNEKLNTALPTLRKAVKEEVLVELRKDQHNPDAGARSPSNAKVTLEEYGKMTAAERAANRESIDKAWKEALSS